MAYQESKQVQIRYYAALREERGLPAETVTTFAGSLRELYLELRDKHGFRLGCERLRVAVNDRFGNWDDELADSDRVVFIPPVSGG